MLFPDELWRPIGRRYVSYLHLIAVKAKYLCQSIKFQIDLLGLQLFHPKNGDIATLISDL